MVGNGTVNLLVLIPRVLHTFSIGIRMSWYRLVPNFKVQINSVNINHDCMQLFEDDADLQTMLMRIFLYAADLWKFLYSHPSWNMLLMNSIDLSPRDMLISYKFSCALCSCRDCWRFIPDLALQFMKNWNRQFLVLPL